MSPNDRMLRQYIAEALDPPRWEEVRAALAGSAALRERLALLLATTLDLPTATWVMPPPGVQGPHILRGQAQWGAVMEGGNDADWVELSVAVPPDQLDHVVVVLERVDHHWEVLFPQSDDEVVTADVLPIGQDGLRRLDVTVARDRERLGVILVPTAPSFDDADPWRAVREAIASGTRPVVTFDVKR